MSKNSNIHGGLMKWVSVENKLPPHSDNVLVALDGGEYAVASMDVGSKTCSPSCGVIYSDGSGWQELNGNVIAWAEIEPPKLGICTIFGSEISFNMVVRECELISLANDIINHPTKYSDCKDSFEQAYYRFLRFLWVRFPNGLEFSLIDIAEED